MWKAQLKMAIEEKMALLHNYSSKNTKTPRPAPHEDLVQLAGSLIINAHSRINNKQSLIGSKGKEIMAWQLNCSA